MLRAHGGLPRMSHHRDAGSAEWKRDQDSHEQDDPAHARENARRSIDLDPVASVEELGVGDGGVGGSELIWRGPNRPRKPHKKSLHRRGGAALGVANPPAVGTGGFDVARPSQTGG
jgi:hypothetical protein